MALLLWALSTVTFITVTVTLVRGKARIQRELEQATKSVNTQSATDEGIYLNPLTSVAIDTRDNIAYGHLSNI